MRGQGQAQATLKDIFLEKDPLWDGSTDVSMETGCFGNCAGKKWTCVVCRCWLWRLCIQQTRYS